jgi:hypothetical protein
VNRVALWILVSAVAAVFFGWQAFRAWTSPVLPGMEAPAGETFPPPAASPPKVGPGKASSFGAGFSSVVARPVFRPDRKPFQEGSADVPLRNYDAELAQYTVLGVLMAGDERKAIVVLKGAPRGERWEVGAGDSLAGFTVKEVGEDGLILTADDREFTLPLYAGGPKAVGAPSPARRKPPTSARPAPGTGRSSPPSAASPNPAASPQQPRPVPRRIPRRTYPRRYTPGQR